LKGFPKRIYTTEETQKARDLISKGHKHRLKLKGSTQFTEKTRHAVALVKKAGYYDLLRTYVRSIEEVDGLTQLREADAKIWANKYAVENPVDAASLLVQKAMQMKEYLEGTLYYGGEAEKRLDQKRIEFLQVLESKSPNEEVRRECARLLKMWRESSLIY